MSAAERAVEAILGGGVAVIPTDTVYGLAAAAGSESAAAALYRLKGRDAIQPTAIVCATVDVLLDRLPELRGAWEPALRALLPGPFTLVVQNPARRFAWLCGDRPDAIGVRVPALEGRARTVLDGVGAVVATSANLPGGPDPRSLGDVPAALRDGADAVVEGGELPGTPSTVLDLTGAEPRVLREGAVPASEALARLAGLASPPWPRPT